MTPVVYIKYCINSLTVYSHCNINLYSDYLDVPTQWKNYYLMELSDNNKKKKKKKKISVSDSFSTRQELNDLLDFQ